MRAQLRCLVTAVSLMGLAPPAIAQPTQPSPAVAAEPAPTAVPPAPTTAAPATPVMVPPPPVLAPAPVVVSPPPPEQSRREQHQPLAGYANGSFFLRDPHDWFVLIPKGRLQIDWYSFLNRGDAPASGSNGPEDKRPKDTLAVRRARVELVGTFARHIDYSIAAEFAAVPGAGSAGAFTDCFIVVDYLPFLKLQAAFRRATTSSVSRSSATSPITARYQAAMPKIGVVRSPSAITTGPGPAQSRSPAPWPTQPPTCPGPVARHRARRRAR